MRLGILKGEVVEEILASLFSPDNHVLVFAEGGREGAHAHFESLLLAVEALKVAAPFGEMGDGFLHRVWGLTRAYFEDEFIFVYCEFKGQNLQPISFWGIMRDSVF